MDHEEWRLKEIAFLDAALDIARTHLQLAEMDLHMFQLRLTDGPGHFDSVIARGRLALEAVGKLLPRVKDADEHRRLQDKHQALEAAIHRLEFRRGRLPGSRNGS